MQREARKDLGCRMLAGLETWKRDAHEKGVERGG